LGRIQAHDLRKEELGIIGCYVEMSGVVGNAMCVQKPLFDGFARQHTWERGAG